MSLFITGEKGFAYTLVTEKDKDFAGSLVRHLEVASQHVPKALIDIANKSSWFRKSRYKHDKGKKFKIQPGKALGVKERPGLGAESVSFLVKI
jgi:ATP-dependent RNA helicase DDX42